MNLSQSVREEILELQKMYPKKRSALIPALHLAQNEIGYLPESIQEEIAILFEIDTNEVNSIVSFYDMFYDKPTGKRIIHLCKGICCMLNGCDEIAVKMCEKLNLSTYGTTDDGQFTLHFSECLGACDKAPMAIIDDNVKGPIHAENLDEILKEGA